VAELSTSAGVKTPKSLPAPNPVVVHTAPVMGVVAVIDTV
jgi:hypothetical protein